MKKVLQSALFLALSLLAVSCGNDDDGIGNNSILVENTNFDVSTTVSSDLYIYGDENTDTNGLYQLGLKIYGVDTNDYVSFDLYSTSEEDLTVGDYYYGGSTLLSSFEYSSSSIFYVNGLTYYPTVGTFKVHEVTEGSGLYSVSFDGKDANGTDLEFDFDGTLSYNDLRPAPVAGEIEGEYSINGTSYDLAEGKAYDFGEFSTGIYNYDLEIFDANEVDFIYLEGYSGSAGSLAEGVYTFDGNTDRSQIGTFAFGFLSKVYKDGVSYDLTSGTFTVLESTSSDYYEIEFSGGDSDGNVFEFYFTGTLDYSDQSRASRSAAGTKIKVSK